jgi:hypothetical protein
MDVAQILAELRQERDQIEEAIVTIERLTSNRPRRGRPPTWLSEITNKRRGRPPGSKNRPKQPTNLNGTQIQNNSPVGI